MKVQNFAVVSNLHSGIR